MTACGGVAWAGARLAGLRSGIAVAVVGGLVASMLGGVPAAAQPVGESDPPVPAEPAAVPDERSALAAARQQGVRVEILSARTESSQSFATPHGTLVVDEHVRPQWVRSADGSWVDADPSLVRGADGSWSPAAATVEMRFSGGGAQAPLASIGAAGATVGLRWPEPLPEPVVEGNLATYRNVAPSVDLQIVADVDGFTHLVVIHSPKALESPELREIVLATDLSGVSLRVVETGAVEAVAGSGAVLFSGPSPMMWDSRDVSGLPPDAEKGDQAAAVDVQPAMEPVPVEVSAGELTLAPDLDMLQDPETVYPVYVDPTWSKVMGGRNKWSLLRKSYPNSSFYNPAVGSTSSSDSTKGIVRAGFVVEDRTYTDRSIFGMSTSTVKYKRVNKATFSLTQGWSYYNCGHSSPPTTQLRSVGGFSSSTTWSNQPSWGSVLATSKKIRKYGHSCGPQRVEYNVTSRVRSAAAAGSTAINLGLRAASESTGNWSRFRTDAKLSMEYNTAPNAPSALRVQGKGCATGSSRPYVTVDRPTFSAKIGDKDSGQQSMTTRFYWWRSSQSRNSSDFVSGTSANPGTANSASIPASKALADRVVYKYQARTSDGIDVTWSGVCEFRAWLTPPNPPADVSSTAYPEFDPDDSGTGWGGVGISGQFTISPPASGVADVTGYAYTMDSGVSASAAPVVTKASGGSATVSLRPRRDGINVLRVWSKDVAGLFSLVVEYRFRVRPGDGPAAQWLFDSAELAGEDDTGHGNSLTLHNGATTGAGRAGVGSAVLLDGSDDVAKTAGSLTRPHPDTGVPLVVRTDETFTVAAWVKPDAGSAAPTAVSVDGTNVSAFMLGYVGATDRWRFAMPNSDVDNPSLPNVVSNAAPVAGRWTHLAGTYDAATGQIRLYVNGVLQSGSATLSGGFHTSGAAVVVGRRVWNGSLRDHFDGQVDDVRVYSFIPPVAELVEAARPLPPVVTFPDGGSATVGGTLRVRFDAAGDTNITSFRYSVGTDALDQTVALGTAGGTATVTVPVTAAGELPVFAASVDRVAHVSESTTAVAAVVGDPEVSGVVYDEVTREPVAGATVMLDQAGLSVSSGAGGEFSFDGFEAGTYTLAANLDGQCGMATATELEVVEPLVVELWLTPARDSFGYACQEAPGTPFTPIGGSALPLTGDDAVAQVGLPFAFPFYGEQHTTAWVDTNGYLTFADPGGSHPAGEGTIPSPSEPSSLIAVFWDDLVVDSAASVRTASAGSAPSRTFAIEWREVQLAGDPAARVSVQVTLHENGFIHVAYSGLGTAAERGQSATVGIESPGGQIGIQYSYKQSVLASDLLIVFSYPAEPSPISTVTLSGTVVDSATGQPAAGVDVLLDPADQSVTTGADGGFAFADLEWGSYVVEAMTDHTHCGKAGQAYVELAGPEQVQVDLVPGSDEYGYLCAAGPQSFLATSAALALSGDDEIQEVGLPFPFVFYGESYSQLMVDTNGLLSFAPHEFSWWKIHEIPSVHYSPGAAVYGFWSDWEVDAQASVRTGISGSAPNRRFVVEWRNVVHTGDSSARVSFQAVLHETSNEITVAWDGIGDNARERGADAVVGIENPDGTIALPYQQFDEAIAAGQGVLFSPGDPGMHEISGEVTCAGVPVAGADVRVGEQAAVTDSGGGFGFTGLPPGPQGLVASAATGACAGSVSMPVVAVRDEPQVVEVAMNPVADAVGYTVTSPATSMLAAGTIVALPPASDGDEEVVQVAPPFPVTLYGQAYSQAWVNTNGYLRFVEDDFSSPWWPFPIPAVEWSPDAAVYPFWNDWVVDSQASIRTGVHGSAPNRQWVVEWRNVRPYNLSQRVSFQVVFEETSGRITFSYSGIDARFVERGGAGLTGVENADSTAAVQFSYLSPVLRTGRGLVLTPTAS